jgi:hypothetical protein
MSNCRACKSKLENGDTRCSICCCPVNLFFWEVKNWDVAKGRMKPRVPTIIGQPEIMPAAKCPNCSMRMYIEDIECPHCEYELSSKEKQIQKEWSRAQMFKGFKLGAIFTIGFIILFTVLFSI